MPEFPPTPSAEEVTGHYDLIGPKPAPTRFGKGLIRYQIIDRSRRNRVVLTMIGPPDDRNQFSGVAEASFRDYKRRLLYTAHLDWEAQVDAIRRSEAA